MPGYNKTGPEGKGSKTGRQMGDCEGAEPVGRGLGRRLGLGRGFGRGRGWRFWDRPVTLSKDEQKKILHEELKEIKTEEEEIEKKLKELK